MINPWLAIFTVLLILLSCIAVLKWYQQAHKPHPEIVRKLLHVIMGGITISFPWLFSEVWPVWILALTSALTLAAIKYLPGLKKTAGSVVCSVNRQTYGELCFPLSVAILFPVAHAQPLLYCVPMAILAIADASSAMVGIFFGKHRYSTAEGTKSAEGSLVFFAITSVFTALPLLMLGVDTWHAVLLSLLLGCLVTAFEAIAWQGLDNLFIPLSAYAMLQSGLHMEFATLAQQLIVAAALLTAAIIWRRRTALDDSAALGAALFCFLSWSIGGWQWLLAPVTVLILHKVILPAKYRRQEIRPSTIHEVIWVTSLGFAWLFLSKVTGQSFLLPYTLTYAAHLAVIGCAHTSLPQAKSLKSHAITQSCLSAWLALIVPYTFIAGQSQTTIVLSVCALLAMLVCSAAFCAIYKGEEHKFHSIGRWTQQTGLVAACSLCVFGLSWLW